MAFLPDGNIVVTDEGFTGLVPDVVEVNPNTGARTLISGGGRGSGPALATPDSVAVEASGDILVSDEGAGPRGPRNSSGSPRPPAIASSCRRTGREAGRR